MKKKPAKIAPIRKSVKTFVWLSLVATVLSFSEPKEISFKYLPNYLGDFQHMKMMLTDPDYRYLMTESPLCALPTVKRL